MKNEFDPGRLDVKAFAEAGGMLTGEEPLDHYPRLAEEIQGDAARVSVFWRVQGSVQAPTGGMPEVRLQLQAQAVLPLVCQRCLGPVDVPLSVDRPFRFAADEEAAQVLDDESEEDVLVLSRDFDVRALVEDEILMALPLVPRHDTCPAPVALQVQDADFEDNGAEKPNPFAVLATLKTGKIG
jgi:uncharacterized protein